MSGFLSERNCNITEAAQFTDTEHQHFFMRIAFATEGERLDLGNLLQLFRETVAAEFEMMWELTDADTKMPAVIMVSKLSHCLHDLLLSWRTGLLPIDLKGMVSNHRDFYQLAASYDIPFHHIPVTPDTKPFAEEELMKVLSAEDAQLVILARYMQVLSDDLSRKLTGRAINIHHSFLPGFKGAKPYAQAHARGVKLIGATAHYVTGDLDEGPIIEQDVERADHSVSPASLSRSLPSDAMWRASCLHAPSGGTLSAVCSSTATELSCSVKSRALPAACAADAPARQ